MVLGCLTLYNSSLYTTYLRNLLEMHVLIQLALCRTQASLAAWSQLVGAMMRFCVRAGAQEPTPQAHHLEPLA